MTLTAHPAADAEDPAADRPPTLIRQLAFELGDSIRAEFADRDASGLVMPPRRMRWVGFDTADGSLARQGISLAIHDDGDRLMHRILWRPEAGLAAACGAGDGGIHGGIEGGIEGRFGPFDRLRWQQPVPGWRPTIDALPPAAEPPGTTLHDCIGRLLPVSQTEVECRSRIVVLDDDARLELACLTGQHRAGDSTSPVAIVEIIHLAGARDRFQRYVLQWARLHRAVLCPGQPGRGRAEARHVAAGRLVPPAPASAESAAAARAVVGACLDALVPLVARMRLLDDEDGPRALGIVLQRLRGTIAFFDLREDPAVATDLPWRAADRLASRLQAANAAVREADRLEDGLLHRLVEALPGDRALASLADALRQARAARRDRLRSLLGSAAATELLLLIAAALAEPGATSPAPAGFPDFASRRLATLGRCCETLVTAGRTAGDRDVLRTALRRLRHGVEASATALPDGQTAKRLVATLVRAQRRLGLEQERLADRSTAAAVMADAGVDAVDAARVLALIDGFHRFADEGAIGRGRPANPFAGPAGDAAAGPVGSAAAGAAGNARRASGDELAALAMLRALLRRARPSSTRSPS